MPLRRRAISEQRSGNRPDEKHQSALDHQHQPELRHFSELLAFLISDSSASSSASLIFASQSSSIAAISSVGDPLKKVVSRCCNADVFTLSAGTLGKYTYRRPCSACRICPFSSSV